MSETQYIITCETPNGKPLYWVDQGTVSVDAECAARFDLQLTAHVTAILARSTDGLNWQAVLEEPKKYSTLTMIAAGLVALLFSALVVMKLLSIITKIYQLYERTN